MACDHLRLEPIAPTVPWASVIRKTKFTRSPREYKMRNSDTSLSLAAPEPAARVSRRAFWSYIAGLSLLLVTSVLVQVWPEDAVVVAAHWSGVAVGAGCLVHVALRAAWQKLVARLSKDVYSAGSVSRHRV